MAASLSAELMPGSLERGSPPFRSRNRMRSSRAGSVVAITTLTEKRRQHPFEVEVDVKGALRHVAFKIKSELIES